jgi:hypothetical protein
MPQFGGMSPFPRRFGGGKPLLKTLTESLIVQHGTAFAGDDVNGLFYLEMEATARVLMAAWEQNQRLANQWDPERMTDFLPRWERIFALPKLPTDTLTMRRARVGVAMARVGQANAREVYDTCKAYLGPIFLGIVTSPSSIARVFTPAGWPMGMHPSSPPDPDWYSTVAHIDVLTTQPATMDDDEYYTTRSSVRPALDAILPGWMTFDIVRDGSHGAGFYLDDPHNLDNERFT